MKGTAADDIGRLLDLRFGIGHQMSGSGVVRGRMMTKVNDPVSKIGMIYKINLVYL